MNQSRISPKTSLLCLAISSVVTSLLSASVLVDPTLYAEIDAAGGRSVTVEATGSTSMATLEGLAGFASVHDYTGFDSGANVISFTSNLSPDIQTSFSGNVSGNTGDEINNSSFATSPTSAIRVDPNDVSAANTLTGVIDFGSWNGSSFNSDVNAVSAAGFTLATTDGRLERLISVTVDFLDSNNTVLSTQTISGINTGSQGFYFGYDASGGEAISSIEFVVSQAAKDGETSSLIFGLDGISFTQIPEASSSSLAILAGVFILYGVRNKRNRQG